MNNENEDLLDLTKVDLSCDYQSGSKLKKYDLISFQIIENNIHQWLKDVDLKNILKMITIASNDESISVSALKYILNQFLPEKKSAAILEILVLPFFFMNKEDDSSNLSSNESYDEYLIFNLKIIIAKELDLFSFATLFGANQEMKVKRGSPRFNIDNISRINQLDLTCVLSFFLFFCKESNEKKAELLFDILDYDKSGQLKTGKKLFYIIFRKLVLLCIFYPDIIMNYAIHKHSSDPHIYSTIDMEYGSVDLTHTLDSNTKTPTDSNINKDRLIFYQTYTDLVFEYKKILFYLRHSRGIMKDLVTFISHSFVFYENKTNPIVSRDLFKSFCKESKYTIFLPGIYREYLIEYLFHNQRRSTLFFNEFPKIIHHLEEMKINNKHNIKREHTSAIMELNLRNEYNKYEKILEEQGFIIEYFINTDKYINKKDLNDLKKQKYKKKGKVIKKELDKEITEICEDQSKREFNLMDKQNDSYDDEYVSERSMSQSDNSNEDEEIKELPMSCKSKGNPQIILEDRIENEKKEKDLMKIGSIEVDVINEEEVDANETISVMPSHYNINNSKSNDKNDDDEAKLVKEKTKTNPNKSLMQLDDSVSNQSYHSKQKDKNINSDDEVSDDVRVKSKSNVKSDVNEKKITNQLEDNAKNLKDSKIILLSIPKSIQNEFKDELKRSYSNNEPQIIQNQRDVQEKQNQSIELEYEINNNNNNNQLKNVKVIIPIQQQQKSDDNEIELLLDDSRNLNIDYEKISNKNRNANANVNDKEDNKNPVQLKSNATDFQLRLSSSSSPFVYNEDENQNQNQNIIQLTQGKNEKDLIKHGDEALEEIPKHIDNYDDTYSENRSIINLTSQLDNQRNSIKGDNAIVISNPSQLQTQSQNNELETEIILTDYFNSLDMIKKTSIDHIKTSLYSIIDSLITQCNLATFKDHFKQFNKNKIQSILNYQMKKDLMNLYFQLMTLYNSFLRYNGETELKVVFFDTQFFQLLQESCHLNSFAALYKQYQNDLFENSTKGHRLIFDEDYIIVIPIHVYLNLANSEQKKLFLAMIEINKRKITFLDSDDVLNDNNEVVMNYKILFDSFFSYLMKEKISRKNLQGFKCECNSIDSMCYDKEYAEIIMVYYSQLISKSGKIRLISDKEYPTIRDNLFKEIAGFFIKLHDHLR